MQKIMTLIESCNRAIRLEAFGCFGHSISGRTCTLEGNVNGERETGFFEVFMKDADFRRFTQIRICGNLRQSASKEDNIAACRARL